MTVAPGRTSAAAAAALVLTLTYASAGAFLPPSNSPLVRSRRLTLSPLRSSEEADRVKSVGGGTDAFFPPGVRTLFDPAEAGKLGGTGSLDARIAAGAAFQLPADSPVDVAVEPTAGAGAAGGPPPGVELQDAQHFLEHLDADGSLPLNFAKPSRPVSAALLGRARIIGPDAPGDIQHIVLRLPEGMHYVEGQSLSVIPPGTDPQTGRTHKPRLYSIASTRYGDALDGRTVSLCVRRAEYYDPATGLADPSKRGVCSNFLCDALPGTAVSVAGPVGKTMLLPKDPSADVIMIATGTGVAPFRAFLHRLFMENTVAGHEFEGTAWLVLGVPVTSGLLYKEEIDAMLRNARPGQLQVDYAISREMRNSVDGGKMYVQHVIASKADELFRRLDNGASVYFCGLKGMMPPVLDTLEEVAAARGVDWSKRMKELKANDQWHVEVY